MSGLREKFILLMQTHWKITKRQPKKFVAEISYPTLICIILIILRPRSEEKDEKRFERFEVSDEDICNNVNAETNTIAFAPDNAYLEKIISEICPLTTVMVPFETTTDLRNRIRSDVNFTRSLLFAVLFAANSNTSEMMRSVRVTIRLPSYFEMEGVQKWHTERLYPPLQVIGPRQPETPYAGNPSYKLRGFLRLQEIITRGLIQNVEKKPLKMKIYMQRYPHPDYFEDKFYNKNITILLAVVISLCFLVRYIYTLHDVTLEKEQQLRESMKAMGLPGWLLWTSWFFYSLMLFLVVVTIMAFLLTFHIKGTAVFARSNGYLLFLFLILASCSVIAFSFFISTLFSKANVASAVGGFFFIFSEIPYVLHKSDTNGVYILVMCLLVGTAICYGVEIIVKLESLEEGIQWDNLWTKTVASEELVFGPILIMCFVDTVLYLIIAAYLDHIFPKPLCCTCSPSSNNSVNSDSDETTSSRKEGNFQQFSLRSPKGIQIEHLSKSFRFHRVIKEFSMIAYEGEITALLGHRDSGKSTILGMITGMIQPSTGQIKVYGFDVSRFTQKVQDNIGLCLQHNIFFGRLTVAEHIHFFCKLKDVRDHTIHVEIKEYIGSLELDAYKHTAAKSLSKAVQRKLNIATALCGGTKVVVLDEPTAGLDPFARKKVWELLQRQKEGRTIFIATQSLEEAEILGDRIAVLSNGELQCFGSPTFLRKKFASEYYLTLETTAKCQPRTVTSELRVISPALKLHSHVGTQLTYRLSGSELPNFEKLLRSIEAKQKLEVSTYGITPTTLEELFLKVGADKNVRFSKSTLRFFETSFEDEKSLFLSQIYAMLAKKMLWMCRVWLLLLVTQMIIPIALIVWLALAVKSSQNVKYKFPPLKFSLGDYNEPVTLLGGEKNDYFRTYKQALHGYEVNEVPDITSEILDKIRESPANVKRHYIVGAHFTKDRATAWFNGAPFHAPPLSLAILLDAIFKTHLGKDRSITFVNHPLPLTTHFQLNIFNDKFEYQLAFSMEYVMICVISIYILFYVRERVCKSKYLQFASGVNPFIFWSVSFLCDLLLYFMAVCIIFITLVILEVDTFREKEELKRVLVLLTFFGIFVLPLIYLMSHFFYVPFNAYNAVLMISFTTGVVGILLVKATDNKVLKYLDWILIFTPFYLLINGLITVIETFNLRDMCLKLGSLKDACQADTKCCGVESYYSLNAHGIGRHLLIAFIMSILLFSILICKDYGFSQCLSTFSLSDQSPDENMTSDSDVIEETQIIRMTDQRSLDRAFVVVVRNLTKRYKKALAVNGICLGIKPSECFGFLGASGAGKSTAFRMMSGELPIPFGEVYINGLSVKTELKKVQKLIGYCPQNDNLLEEFTPRETLQMFALIQGLSLGKCKHLAQCLAHDFDFYIYLDKPIRLLSIGTRRKLSTALSLVGDPKIIFLDQPTEGMDPLSKRAVWNSLNRLRNGGKCIVLASQSVEECEALCTRMVIMVNGNFQCLGSLQKLRSKFAHGYTLTVRLTKGGNLNRKVAAMHTFVKKYFLGSLFKERFQNVLTYKLDDEIVPYSEVFRIVEEEKETLNIEDYAIQKCNLEQVFQIFTRIQQ